MESDIYYNVNIWEYFGSVEYFSNTARAFIGTAEHLKEMQDAGTCTYYTLTII